VPPLRPVPLNGRVWPKGERRLWAVGMSQRTFALHRPWQASTHRCRSRARGTTEAIRSSMCAWTARTASWSYNGRSSVNGDPRRLPPQSASPVVAPGGRLRLHGGCALWSVTRSSEPGKAETDRGAVCRYGRLQPPDRVWMMQERLNGCGRLRGALIDPAIDEHGGRIVQTGGDSLLGHVRQHRRG